MRWRAATLTHWPDVSTGAQRGRSQATEQARRRGSRAGWEENRNFSLKVTPEQVGSGPGGRRQGRGRGKVWSRLEEHAGQEAQGEGGPGGDRRPGGHPAGPSCLSGPLLLVGISQTIPWGPMSTRLGRPVSRFFSFDLSKWPLKKGFRILCTEMWGLREGKYFCGGHTAWMRLTAGRGCGWIWESVF